MLACARGGTFKYFLDRDAVAPVWRDLEAEFGPAASSARMGTVEIETRAFILRSTRLMNPITVFRKRACKDRDVDALHALLGFDEDEGTNEGS